MFAVDRAPTEHPAAIAFGALVSVFGHYGDRLMILGAIGCFVALVAGMYRLGRVAFIPVIGWLWLLVDLFILAGNKCRNSYGRAPHGHEGQDLFAAAAAPAAAAPSWADDYPGFGGPAVQIDAFSRMLVVPLSAPDVRFSGPLVQFDPYNATLAAISPISPSV